MAGQAPSRFRIAAVSEWLEALYDAIYSRRRMHLFERSIAYLSVAGFLAHLVVVFLSRAFPWAARLQAMEGENYLAAIYTPFTIILLYEVLILISAIPQSPANSMATQFEIVSLIYFRGFFHEIGQLDLGRLHSPPVQILPRMLDEIGGGFLLFLLVTVFKRVACRPGGLEEAERAAGTRGLILWKKAAAIVLTILFFVLAAADLQSFGSNVLRILFNGAAMAPDANLSFFTEVITAMIFAEVFVLILSLTVSGAYEVVFRNAAFVVAGVLMRFALLAEQPWALLFATTGIGLAILTVLVFNYAGTSGGAKSTRGSMSGG